MNDAQSRIAVVLLDDARFAAGPATVLELTTDPIADVVARYTDRDGARDPRVRFWRAPVGAVTSMRVHLRDE